MGELFAWRVGLARLPSQAKAFYGVIAAATAIGVGLNFTSIVMMHLSMRPRIMSGFTLPPTLRILGWVATGVMAATVVAMGVTWFA